MTYHSLPGFVLLIAVLVTQPFACRPRNSEVLTIDQKLGRFESQAEELRQQLRIPGLSAVILKDQKVVWSKGFGFADQEKQVPATPDTLYHIASLTKTLAATLIMQLVEQGQLSLDEPVSRYSNQFPGDSVRIKHLLRSHFRRHTGRTLSL